MLLFAILQFINVVLGSLRSLTTAKGSRTLATIFNVVGFTFYAAIVKLTSGQEMWFVLVITALTNLIGYYLADIIFCKAQKDRLWKITLEPMRNEDVQFICDGLRSEGIGYTEHSAKENYTVLEIYSYSQEDSVNIKSIINCFKNKPRYFITENTKSL